RRANAPPPEPRHYYFNAITHRRVTAGGRRYYELLNAGWDIENDYYLVPPEVISGDSNEAQDPLPTHERIMAIHGEKLANLNITLCRECFIAINLEQVGKPKVRLSPIEFRRYVNNITDLNALIESKDYLTRFIKSEYKTKEFVDKFLDNLETMIEIPANDIDCIRIWVLGFINDREGEEMGLYKFLQSNYSDINETFNEFYQNYAGNVHNPMNKNRVARALSALGLKTEMKKARRQLYINRKKIIDEFVSKQNLRRAVDFIYALNLNKIDELEALIDDYKNRRDDLLNKLDLESELDHSMPIISELKVLVDQKIMYLIHYINVCEDTFLITEEAKNQNMREWEEQTFLASSD
ncbi:10879_t:CDS:2, partial [Paraglomus occultum]